MEHYYTEIQSPRDVKSISTIRGVRLEFLPMPGCFKDRLITEVP